MAPALPATIVDQLQKASTQPRLTWYDADGRLELSGHVCANWVVKSTNLLVEELDIEPGSRVILDLPVHWRAVLWALATWRAGACVVLPPEDMEPSTVHTEAAGDVIITNRPEHWQTTADVVAVALPALARQYDGDLPPGALDAAQSVMTYGDALGVVPPWEATAAALEVPETRTEIPHHDLAARLVRHAMHETTGSPLAPDPQLRALVSVGPHDLLALVATCALAWASDASVVVVPSTEDPERVERIAVQEHVTARTRAPRTRSS